MEEASSYSRAVFKRMLLYHWYRKGKSAREATELLCTDYGRGFVSERVVLQVYLCLADRANFKFDFYCMGNGLDSLVDDDGRARRDEFENHNQQEPVPTYHHQYNSHQHQQHYYEPTSYQVPSTVHRLPSTVHQLPSTVHQLSSTVKYLPSTVNQLPSTVHRPPSTVHQLPSTVNQLPSTTDHNWPQSTSTFNQSTYESTNVYDASSFLNTNLIPSTSHSTSSTSNNSRKSNTNLESYDSNKFPQPSQPAPQPASKPAVQPVPQPTPPQPLYTVERKLPPDYLYEDGTVVPRLAKRHLILRCYNANYTVDQCKRYLVSLNLPINIYRKTIIEWYKRFEHESTIADKSKPGRTRKVSDEALEQYMAAHPRARTARISRHFKLANGTICRRLKNLGYDFKFDRFVKLAPDEPENELSDEQLFEYKFAHPEAKASDIGAHFNVRHMWINERLRRMGFVIPKYFKKSKPTKRPRTNAEDEQEDQNGSSSSSDSDSSDSNFRVYPQRRPKTPGRPKGTKNIEHKGLLLHPKLGTPVTDIHEARQILRQARTLTKEEQIVGIPSVPKEGIHKKDLKKADYTKDSSIAISLTEILLNSPVNIPLPPPPPSPKKVAPLPLPPLLDEVPIPSKPKPKQVKVPPKVPKPAKPRRPMHLYKRLLVQNPKFALKPQLTTTIEREEDDGQEIITIDIPSIDLPENDKIGCLKNGSNSCDDTVLDELSFDPLSNLELHYK